MRPGVLRRLRFLFGQELYENCNRHDLDFGGILAATKADSTSVLKLRIQNISLKRIGESVVSASKQFEELPNPFDVH